MQTVAEVPDDAIAQLEASFPEERVEEGVKRHNLAVVDEIAHLPANRPLRMKQPDALADHLILLVEIGVQISLSLIRLAEVVGR